jgi:hypothetical protein
MNKCSGPEEAIRNAVGSTVLAQALGLTQISVSTSTSIHAEHGLEHVLLDSAASRPTNFPSRIDAP